jgi:hypothetical protein
MFPRVEGIIDSDGSLCGGMGRLVTTAAAAATAVDIMYELVE